MNVSQEKYQEVTFDSQDWNAINKANNSVEEGR